MPYGFKLRRSNFNECLRLYKKLEFEIGLKEPFRGGKTSVMIADLIFSQRLGYDHTLSKNDFEDISRGIEEFNNNNDFGLKELMGKY